jgi:putative ABC transport system ATP-binding protein
VGLAKRISHIPSKLSGGEKQRVAIARALINDPTLILADEPTGNLDSVSSNDVLDILHNLHKQGKTIIIVTHEEEIGNQCERIIRLKDGGIV